MINDGVNNIPEYKIAAFPVYGVSPESIKNIITKPSKKREWFTPHFYKCLPLTIANQYGFLVSSEFDFIVHWNGGNSTKDLWFTFPDGIENIKDKYPGVRSHFGNGIFTLEVPYVFKTPPGVNLMVIPPTNYILPNMSVLTGVVESDNIRFTFTVNVRMMIPDIDVYISAGTPLATLLPIPRYFAEQFEIVNPQDVLPQDVIDEEMAAFNQTYQNRQTDHSDGKANKQYFRGVDCYGNKFKDHQGPSLNNVMKNNNVID